RGSQHEIVTILPAGDAIQIGQLWDRDNRPEGGALSRTLQYAPGAGKRRVFIIERADTLTQAAANSLLKALEEPPPYVLFVLCAPHPARLLPTINSRCQIVRVNPVDVAALAAYLSETLDLPREQALLFASYAEGRTGKAVQMATNPAYGQEIERFMELAVTLPEAPPARALRVSEQIRKLAASLKAFAGEEPESKSAAEEAAGAPPAKEAVSRRNLAAGLDLLAAFYRDLLILRAGVSHESVVNRLRLDELSRLASAGTQNRWAGCLDSILLARRRLDANANVAMVFDALAIRLVSAAPAAGKVY
ncbi:MAG TPA: hypothetical protein VGS41_16350, partial [Chthonomonadales bacterium]|nr:hypothetical protein [Chthonomonadales bacterium]